MIYARPGEIFEAAADGLVPGLATGTPGVAIKDKPAGGTVTTARTTAGISEEPAGSGHYGKSDLAAPAAAGRYWLFWDSGTNTPPFAVEELQVTYTGGPDVVLPGGAYAGLADVERLNAQRTFTATSKPNSDEVVGYLRDTAAVIDGILRRRRYQLPVPAAATAALGILNLYNAYGAFALSERAAGASPHRDAAEKLWADAQKMLRDGLVELDTPRNRDTTLSRGVFPATAMFTRDQEL